MQVSRLRSGRNWGQNLFIQNFMRYLILFLLSILLFTACRKAASARAAGQWKFRANRQGRAEFFADESGRKKDFDERL